jgi:serine/threonine protein kinase
MGVMLANERECLTESCAVRVVAAALASTEKQTIERHLGDCPRCRGLMSEVLRDTGSERVADRLQPRVLQNGMILSDRYQVRGFLGLGAMGEVHQAEDLLLGKVVALKTLNARLLGSPEAVARLKREVAAAHRVTHPNVCRIFDLGIDCRLDAAESLVFITMEFLEGRTLASLLGDSALDLATRAELLRQLARGLAAAHAAGVVHRDLKPENVMVTRAPDGTLRAVITDFGLAGSGFGEAGEHAPGSGLSGTLAYAAPERLAGQPATAASDIFSFGLLASEVLLRKRNLRGPAELGAIPPEWRKLVARTVDRNPEARFADGAALVSALERGPHPVWRGRTPLAVAGFVVAAGLLLSVGSRARLATPAPERPSPAVERAPVPRPQPTRESSAPLPKATTLEERSKGQRPRRAGLARSHSHAPPSVPSRAEAPAPHAESTPAPGDPLVRDVAFDRPQPRASAELLNPY